MEKSAKKLDKNAISREKRLVRRCIGGDKKAWDEFVDTYKGLIYSTIFRTFHFAGYKNAEECAADIFQSFFAYILENNFAKLRSFKWKNGCSLASWLHIIAKSLTFDYLRKILSRQRWEISLKGSFAGEKSTSEKELSSLKNKAFEKLEHEEKLQILKKAIQKLPRRDIYLIELLYIRGLSYQRVATILRKSIGALYMQKKRLIEKLKKAAKGYS